MNLLNKITNAASGGIFYPLWDLWDRSPKLKEMRRLEKAQWTSNEAAQRDALFAQLKWAYETTPFYRARGAAPKTMEEFHRVPLLTKDDVRQNLEDLISDHHDARQLLESKTGGSTGVSLRIFSDFRCQQFRNAAALRSDKWSGWKLGETRGALWGNPPVAEGFKAKVRAALLDRLIYLDTVEMSADSMDQFAESLIRNGVEVLYGHAHSLFVFANRVAARHDNRLKIRSIISTSMVLLPNERRRIESVFDCPVTDRYGCEEVGLIASECETHHGLHVNTDHLFIEVLRADGTPASPEEEGRVVITDLINRGMPMIRYAVGDVAIPSSRSCPCGRQRPLWERVIGRTADFLVKPDGTLVAGVSLVERTLTAIPGLAQMQIVQDRADELVINVVPDNAYSEETERRLRDEISRVFGPVLVSIRLGDKLVQEKNGKYRFAICRVPTTYQEAAR